MTYLLSLFGYFCVYQRRNSLAKRKKAFIGRLAFKGLSDFVDFFLGTDPAFGLKSESFLC